MIELELGILVYPPETEGEPWRAIFTENGQRRFLQGTTEAKLAAKLEKVTERLSAGAENAERPGRDLIAHYLDPAGCQSRTGGRASTHTRSNGCASGSPRRSSTR